MIFTAVVAVICLNNLVSAGGPSHSSPNLDYFATSTASTITKTRRRKTTTATTPEPDERIKCCRLANGTISYFSDEKYCGKCARKNDFIYVDISNDDKLCCHENHGKDKPDTCIYDSSERPDPNEVGVDFLNFFILILGKLLKFFLESWIVLGL